MQLPLLHGGSVQHSTQPYRPGPYTTTAHARGPPAVAGWLAGWLAGWVQGKALVGSGLRRKCLAGLWASETLIAGVLQASGHRLQAGVTTDQYLASSYRACCTSSGGPVRQVSR